MGSAGVVGWFDRSVAANAVQRSHECFREQGMRAIASSRPRTPQSPRGTLSRIVIVIVILPS